MINGKDIDKASKEMKPIFVKLLKDFVENAKKKYPMLEDEDNLSEFLEKIFNNN